MKAPFIGWMHLFSSGIVVETCVFAMIAFYVHIDWATTKDNL